MITEGFIKDPGGVLLDVGDLPCTWCGCGILLNFAREFARGRRCSSGICGVIELFLDLLGRNPRTEGRGFHAQMVQAIRVDDGKASAVPD